ncbi:MAG TPA: TIGR02281 family clan AA aspartic protease [Maritimibacter sp.]|nr:TIGR02281 family clan AA aspartic protease [Maritimibacter sp.]
MDSFDYARLAYLSLLGAAIAGSFIMMNKANLGKSLQHLAIWVLIFIGAIGAYGLWTDIQRDVLPRQSVVSSGVVEVPRGLDGHFYLTLRMNDEPVQFMVDTGASEVVLTGQDARKIGIDPDTLDFIGTASTANGVVRTAPTRVDQVRLGDIRTENLKVYVNEGEMSISLLGMTYLRQFDRIEIRDDLLILTR